MFKFTFSGGDNSIGKADANFKPNIALSGVGIGKPHCLLNFNPDDRTTVLSPNKDDFKKFKVMLNGQLLEEPTTLNHADRILIGTHFYYQYVDPMVNYDEGFDYDEAVKEANPDAGNMLAQSEEYINQIKEMEAKIKHEQEAKEKELEEMKAKMQQEREDQIELMK